MGPNRARSASRRPARVRISSVHAPPLVRQRNVVEDARRQPRVAHDVLDEVGRAVVAVLVEQVFEEERSVHVAAAAARPLGRVAPRLGRCSRSGPRGPPSAAPSRGTSRARGRPRSAPTRTRSPTPRPPHPRDVCSREGQDGPRPRLPAEQGAEEPAERPPRRRGGTRARARGRRAAPASRRSRRARGGRPEAARKARCGSRASSGRSRSRRRRGRSGRCRSSPSDPRGTRPSGPRGACSAALPALSASAVRRSGKVMRKCAVSRVRHASSGGGLGRRRPRRPRSQAHDGREQEGTGSRGGHGGSTPRPTRRWGRIPVGTLLGSPGFEASSPDDFLIFIRGATLAATNGLRRVRSPTSCRSPSLPGRFFENARRGRAFRRRPISSLNRSKAMGRSAPRVVPVSCRRS